MAVGCRRRILRTTPRGHRCSHPPPGRPLCPGLECEGNQPLALTNQSPI